MKNIAELLNQTPQTTQALGASQGVRSASSNPGNAQGESFGDVVNRLAAQNSQGPGGQSQGNGAASGTVNAPQDQAAQAPNDGSVPASSQPQTGDSVQAAFLDQVDIRFTETIRGQANSDQVKQSMAALASAFQQMVGFLLSNPGASAGEAQAQIVSAAQGTVSADAAKALVAAVQGFLQSLPPGQKALLSDETARKNLFNQLFQGLAQAVAGAPVQGGATTESFDFQMAFGSSSTTIGGSTQGSQFFGAGLSMTDLNDQGIQTSFSNSILDQGPLGAVESTDLGQEANILLTDRTSGRDLADLLGRAGAGQVKLSAFTQNQPTTSADQLNRLAPVDFNRAFSLLTDSLRQAAFQAQPPSTLQPPAPAVPQFLGTAPSAAPATSILASPAVVTLQNQAPQALTSADPAARALAVQAFFERLSVSFNAVTAASAPAQSQSVTSPAFTQAPSNTGKGAGQGQAPLASSLEAVPQVLNSTPASGNVDQSQDVQTFQNFLRSTVVVQSASDSFSVDQAPAQAPPPPAPNPVSGPTADQPAPRTQAVLQAQPTGQPVVTPPSDTPSGAPVVALTGSNAPQPPVGTTPQETITPASFFTNAVVVGENVKPVVAQVVAAEAAQNPNQALPTDPNLSAVQSINPVLAEGVNSVSTVGQFAALKDQSFKEQDALSGIPAPPATTADSTSLAGAATFLQAVQANGNTAGPANTPFNAAGVIQQFAEQISQHVAQNHSVSQLSFQLVPENLGRVTVQVALVDQSVSARIVVSNPNVQEGLQHHLVDLKAALNQAGLQIDQLQVQVQGGGSNLLSQYFQYQQEGASYGAPVGYAPSFGSEAVESGEPSSPLSIRAGLVNLLA